MKHSSPGTKVRFATAGFGVVAGGIILFSPLNYYSWAGGVFLAVIVAALITSRAIDVASRHRRGVPVLGPDDLDRKGGQYDHLHGRQAPRDKISQ